MEKKRTWIQPALVVTLLVLGAGVVATWAVTKERQDGLRKDVAASKVETTAKFEQTKNIYSAQLNDVTKNTDKKIGQLKEEGCKPSRKNQIDLVGVAKDITAIQKDLEGIRSDQAEGFKEILGRLPKK